MILALNRCRPEGAVVTDNIKASLWLDDEPPPPPERAAYGAWVCECGLTKYSALKGTPGMSIVARCMTCGDEAQVFPQTEPCLTCGRPYDPERDYAWVSSDKGQWHWGPCEWRFRDSETERDES